MPKSQPIAPNEDAPTPASNRQQRIDYLIGQIEEADEAQIAELQAEVDRLENLSDEEFDEELSEEEEFEYSTEGEDASTTGGIEVLTTTSSPTEAPTVAPSGAATPPTEEIDPETGKPYSKYKARLRELKRDALGAEIPLELADMMRAAAKKAGDIAVTAWIRLAWADAVNNAGLEHEVPDDAGVSTNTVPWVFDKKRLEITLARTSTRGLSTEEKEKKEAEKKAAAVDQRSLVKFLLVEHKVKTGVPLNAAEVEVLKANNREDLLNSAKLIG